MVSCVGAAVAAEVVGSNGGIVLVVDVTTGFVLAESVAIVGVVVVAAEMKVVVCIRQ